MRTLLIILSAWRGINTNVIVALSTIISTSAAGAMVNPAATPTLSPTVIFWIAVSLTLAKSLESTIEGWIVDLKKALPPPPSKEYALDLKKELAP